MQGLPSELGGFRGWTNKLVDGCSWWAGGCSALLDGLEGEVGEDGVERMSLSRSADSYHTLYCLSGLSATQHRVALDAAYKRALEGVWVDKPEKAKTVEGESPADAAEMRKEVYTSALSWNEVGTESGKARRKILGGDVNRVNATHPLFNLTVTHTEGMMAYFYGQDVVPPRPGPAPGTKKAS